MTTTAATAKLRFLPGNGIVKTVADTEISAMWLNGAGWKVQARKDGLTTSSTLVAHEHEALAAFNALVEQAETEQPAEAPATQPVKLAPAAKGTTTRMTGAETAAIGQALDSTGHIRRGRGAAAADLNSLLAMARRGFITLTGPQFRPTGGDVTDWGKRIYKEAIAERDAAQDKRDRINRVLADIAA